MSAYRFCRTDDVGLLVDALNHCWAPYFPGEPAMTPAAFKRSIRDLQVWCSSCMVAFAGPDPIGVLIGAKRPSGTLIHKIAVHPDHLRQGHGRHLLDSLSSKLAILGPPRLVAEVPDALAPACALFSGCGYAREGVLTDYVLGPEDHRRASADMPPGRFVIPVTIDDLAANGLFQEREVPICWGRAVETLTARKSDLAGVAVASEDRLEAYLLYMQDDTGTQIMALRALIDDGQGHLAQLVGRMPTGSLRFSKVHPEEMLREDLEALGFSPAATHRLYARRAGHD